MTHWKRSALASALTLAGTGMASGALAAETNAVIKPEEMVVTASGLRQRIVDAPASISVVTSIELQQRPYITLIDAVRELEGVDVGETSDKTGQRTISMRGMGSDYTLILIDGKRQNNHGDIYPNAFGGNQFNHIPPLDMIERIEVIRGPASTLYGADALGGVINVITKKVSDNWSGSLTTGRTFQQQRMFGETTSYDFAAQGPLIPGVLGLSVRGAHYEREASLPEYEVVMDPDGQAHQRALGFGGGGKTVDNRNRTLGFSLSWKPSDNQSLIFDYDVSRQVYDNTPEMNNLGTLVYPLGTVDSIETIWRGPTQPPRVGYAADQRFTRDQWALTHQGEWGFGNSFLSIAHINTGNHGRTLPFTVEERLLHAELRQGLGEYEGLSEQERRALAEEIFLPRPKRDMESRQYTVDARVDIPIEDLWGHHNLVLGGQYIDGKLEDGVFGMEVGNDGAGAVQKHVLSAVFIEDNWTLFAPFTVTAGVRYDDHNLFGGNVSPRLYGVYTLSEQWTVKGGVSTGYKTPKTTDLYDGVIGFGGQGTSPQFGNPELTPETSVNTEIAAYWTSATRDHNLNVTLFRNRFEDKIERGGVVQDCATNGGIRPCANLGAWMGLGIDQATQRINIDSAEVLGVEVAGRYKLSEPLSFRANYTWTDSEQTSGPQAGQPLTNNARHMANATLDWMLTQAWSLQLTGESRSERYRGVDSEGQHLFWKGYNILHLGSQYHFNDNLTLSLRVNNLLDKDFTTFDSNFIFDEATGLWNLQAQSHYNNIDPARSFWVSMNARF